MVGIMDHDQTSKKTWTSPALEALEIASTAGGEGESNEANEFNKGAES